MLKADVIAEFTNIALRVFIENDYLEGMVGDKLLGFDKTVNKPPIGYGKVGKEFGVFAHLPGGSVNLVDKVIPNLNEVPLHDFLQGVYAVIGHEKGFRRVFAAPTL